jgi:hypothetical protein
VQKKIAIATPIGYETGGPEALHQLCHTMRKFGHDAYLLPMEGTESNRPIENYSKYDAPIDTSFSRDSILVVPEIAPDLILKSERAIIWWLSADNSPLSQLSRAPKPTELNSEATLKSAEFWDKFYSSQVINCSQSFYAKNFLNNVFDLKPVMLTDYINKKDLFLEKQKEKEGISFSSRGAEYFDYFVSMLPEFNCVRIIGMNKEQAMGTLANSRLYVDLGHQPGRDRMPREAALHNALVMLNSKGAGANYQDAPLSTDYKFKVEDADRAVEKIKNTLHQPSVSNDSQQFYREWVESQQEIFEFEVWKLLRVLG